jgi:hypothetical protein
VSIRDYPDLLYDLTQHLQNRHQLVSAVVHIMNDDLRRNFMYAVSS